MIAFEDQFMNNIDAARLNAQLRERLMNEGWSFEICEPCDDIAIDRLQKRALRDLGLPLAQTYLRFLRLADGMQSGGCVLYSSCEGPLKMWSDDPNDPPEGIATMRSGIVEENSTLREADQSLAESIVFGHSELDYLVWRSSESQFQLISRVTDQVWERFETMEEMLQKKLPTPVLELLGLTEGDTA
jgi:hypothetical protein